MQMRTKSIPVKVQIIYLVSEGAMHRIWGNLHFGFLFCFILNSLTVGGIKEIGML